VSGLAVESAAFWLGDAATMRVNAVIVPSGAGVTFEALSIRISERWMMALDRYCVEHDAVVLGAVHTHPQDAFFSGIDADGFFHAPDCVSVVLPAYGTTRMDEASSRWAIYVGLPLGGWRQATWTDTVRVKADLPFDLMPLAIEP
jgi:proteasome lid subunit RPN8/RPN11